MPDNFIVVEGARQNNLKNIDLRLPLNKLIAVTGVSGSGKSSLAFDTIYSEGQRRYVETFSTYTRQFLDRMDKPKVDSIEGIPPAIAIDQTNPVRTSRSTVGTMTELNDHIKLLFARAARLYCRSCGKAVNRDTPESIYRRLLAAAGTGQVNGKVKQAEYRVFITFPVTVPDNFTEEEVKDLLAKQGYRRILLKEGNTLEVVQDRVQIAESNRSRILEDLDTALKHGKGRVNVHPLGARERPLKPERFSTDLHCAECNIHYRDPVPNLFSFNSPIGACGTCRGFGRTIGIDYDLVVPDHTKTLAEGAVKPWQSESYKKCQVDMMRSASRRGIPTDVPWRKLKEKQKLWVLEGEGDWNEGKWYGVKGFFNRLETKSYRMHIRVLLSRYRAYRLCQACGGARLKDEALLWRLASGKGITVHDVMLLPIERCSDFFHKLKLPRPMNEAAEMLLGEIRSRLGYLTDVGLGYLTLDRQSRTLSGGEVQRINLTTALGTSLVNTLFVLDEPSIGLHSRDIRRLIQILHRLRNAGNTLIVVEHDPEVIRAADIILDMGPGPGERGGNVVFFGGLEELLRGGSSLTAQYLAGKKAVFDRVVEKSAGSSSLPSRHIEILGAGEHNLKNIDVRVPLDSLVCITGVSGSGKSTLVQDVLYNALRKLKNRPVETPGKHRAILGHELVDDVILVDQSPIGKTTRSNPASYVGAFDGIRKLFSREPLALERRYTPGTFSFNSGKGRCPTCEGSGFERIEMQFLSDVYLRCPDCDGRRYRAEVMDVKLLSSVCVSGETCTIGDAYTRCGACSNGNGGPGQSILKAQSIADVLEMTVAEACAFFSGYPEIIRALEPILAVGLDYIRLGQSVPTLSGGESQRLKLAGRLAHSRSSRKSSKHTLFLFDEPTTGLHFDDIATLLRAFRRLLDAGHSVVVIEHNLDVINAADWIIDLGPEGGEKGGKVVCEGTPRQIEKIRESHTAEALRQSRETEVKGPDAGSDAAAGQTGYARKQIDYTPAPDHSIFIRHAREHNLQGIDVRIPRDKFTVITGVSGSGKSTVAFDILFAEGQRRYLESLNAYARQFVQPAGRPDVDGVFGIPPTVAIEQRTSRGGRKSTVATMTEIYHFLRLLFVKLGTQYCPDCGIPIQPQSREAILKKIINDNRGQRVTLLAPLVAARKGYYTDLAKWAAGKGFSHLRVDGRYIPTENWPRLDRFREHNIELPVAEQPVSARTEIELRRNLDLALDLGKGMVYAAAGSETVFSTRRACPRCGRSFKELDPRLFSFNSKHGWCPRCSGTGLSRWGEWRDGLESLCPGCRGQRLRPEALAVKYRDRTITEFTGLPVEAAEAFFRSIDLRGREAQIARDIIAELRSRLAFLKQVGLPYLSLDRAAPTLSGGEAQRIRLASQLGSNLRGVCYILDEPTIGLHAHDNRKLLGTLDRLKAKGNTVVVVEHDAETIRHAEHVVDLGPGGGVNGGRLVEEGTVEDLIKNKQSLTGRFLSEPLRHPLIKNRRVIEGGFALEGRGALLEIIDAGLHNLKKLRVKIPLENLVCVTGVSGSGKSTLVSEILYENLKRLLNRRRSRRSSHRSRQSAVPMHGCREIHGWQSIQRVLEVDQAPIGKTPRSCPATYVGLWDEVRRLFSRLPEARMRGYTAGRFSFNVAGGRCEECAGQGVKKIEMSFLPDVSVGCEVCNSERYNQETLSIRFKNKSIGDILAMSVDEAVGFFTFHSSIHHTLSLLQDVGLGYLLLGQQSPTLSGGEAQRIKLVTELAKTKLSINADVEETAHRSNLSKSPAVPQQDHSTQTQASLYVLDEPTIGLHMADVEKLIRVLHRLVDAGNTVVIIEHNLDIIAEADWIIDLGPEGGDRGGFIVAQGPPESIARVKKESYTARAMARFLKRSQNRLTG